MTLKVAHVTTVDLTLRFLVLPQLVRLKKEGFDVFGISADGPWTKDLEDEGIHHIVWPHATRSWSPVDDMKAFFSLLRILRRERFDVVHTHNPKPGFLGRIAARMAGVPVVLNTVHGLYATPTDSFPKRFVVLMMERVAAMFSDLELYQSDEDLSWARRTGVVGEKKSRLLGNGIDLSYFDPEAVPRGRFETLRAKLGIATDAILVGTVGRFVEEKGYQEFFETAKNVAESIPNTRFLALGDVDPQKSDTLSSETLAAARDNVILPGWTGDVRDLLGLMDVFVLASWREGLPRSAIEAAAMGKPLVLTNIRGCREVARHDEEGLLVPPRDSAGLTEAIKTLALDETLRTRLGLAARRRAETHFNEVDLLERLVSAYQDLILTKNLSPYADGKFIVRKATVLDAKPIARLHKDSLPDAFLPLLGKRFLARLYRALAVDKDAVTLVAESEGKVVGFACGVIALKAFYRRFVKRHGIQAAVLAGPRLLRPAIFRRVLESSRYPKSVNVDTDVELVSIAVDARWRNKGVGRSVAERLLLDLEQRGADKVRVVVASDNRAAIDFYSTLGFQEAAVIKVHEGRASNLLIKS